MTNLRKDPKEFGRDHLHSYGFWSLWQVKIELFDGAAVAIFEIRSAQNSASFVRLKVEQMMLNGVLPPTWVLEHDRSVSDCMSIADVPMGAKVVAVEFIREIIPFFYWRKCPECVALMGDPIAKMEADAEAYDVARAARRSAASQPFWKRWWKAFLTHDPDCN